MRPLTKIRALVIALAVLFTAGPATAQFGGMPFLGGGSSSTLDAQTIAFHAAWVAAGSPTILAEYGSRRLEPGYTGKLFNVHRGSDSTNIDIGYIPSTGIMDVGALNTFCEGAGNNTTYLGPYCTVAIRYDQSSNGRDETQTTVNDQPIIDAYFKSGNVYGASTIPGYLTMPNSVTGDMTAVSLVTAVRSVNIGADWIQILASPGTEFASGTQCGLYQQNLGTTAEGATQSAMIGGFSLGTSVSTGAYIDCNGETNTQGTSFSPGVTFTGAITGAAPVGKSEDVAQILYGVALSQTNLNNLQAALATATGIATGVKDVIIGDGDSRTAGVGTTIDDDTWTRQMENILGETHKYYNTGHSGDTCGNRVTDYPGYDAPLYNPTATNNVIDLWCGTNDIASSESAATIYGYITTFVSDAHTTGFLVVCTTELYDRTWSGAEIAVANTLDSDIRGNAAGCDVVIDLEAQANIGGTGGPNSSWSPDGLHLLGLGSNNGYAIVAQTFATGNLTILH
jgi:hypothetical protein